MRIGELAEACGVKVVTIRFYEAEGLLPPAARGQNGYRHFPSSMEARVRFIRRGQELGFRLSELRQLLAASDRRTPLDHEVRAAGRQKIADLDGRIADLGRMKTALETLLRRRRCAPPDTPCPIIAALGDDQGLAEERRSRKVAGRKARTRPTSSAP